VAQSDVSIANSALSKIGAGSIIALTDNTPQGTAVNARYAAIRDAELRRHVWRFSVKRASLAALNTTPVFGYTYEYQLPSDCLRVLTVGQNAPGLNLSEFRDSVDDLDYTIEGRKILTEYTSPLYVRYVYRVEDPTQFDPAFAEAFAARLGYELATALSDSTSRKEQAGADYKESIREAIRANALEQPAMTLPDDSWLASRA
jgi:hypothetical protein